MIIPPRILTDALPPKERDAAQAIKSNLYALSSAIGYVSSALELCTFCNDSRPPPALPGTRMNIPEISKLTDWKAMALRSAIITIYDCFEISHKTLPGLCRSCPTINARVNPGAERDSTELFKQFFPGMEGLRNHAAHPSRVTSHPDKLAGHRTKIGATIAGVGTIRGPAMISGMMAEGNTWSCTVDHEQLTFTLTRETVERFRGWVEHRFVGFEGAADYTRQAGVWIDASA